MITLLKKIQNFISYWYLRYLLATELYMVEPWEKAVMHIVLFILFGIFWYYNYLLVNSRIFTASFEILANEKVL